MPSGIYLALHVNFMSKDTIAANKFTNVCARFHRVPHAGLGAWWLAVNEQTTFRVQ